MNINKGDIISEEDYLSLKNIVGFHKEVSLYPHKGEHSYVLSNGYEFMKEDGRYELVNIRNIGFEFATPDKQRSKSYYDNRKV